jgi:hypothetical protein
LARTQAEIARCKDPAAVRARWQKSGFAPEDLHLFVRDDRVPIRRAEVLRRMIAYHARMRGRFESAVWRPWRSVEQDEMPEWDMTSADVMTPEDVERSMVPFPDPLGLTVGGALPRAEMRRAISPADIERSQVPFPGPTVR